MDDTIMNNDLTRQVLQKVREYMAAKKMSMSEFARQTGVSKAWLSKLKHTDANLSLNTAQDLLHYMGYTLRLTREGSLQISPSRLKKYATNYVKDGYLLWVDSLNLTPAPVLGTSTGTETASKLKLKRKAAEAPAIGVGVTTMSTSTSTSTPSPAPAVTVPAPPTITSPNSNQAPVKLSPGQAITVSASASDSDLTSGSTSVPSSSSVPGSGSDSVPTPASASTQTLTPMQTPAPTPTPTTAEISEENLNRTANFKDLRRVITAAAKEQQKYKEQNAAENNEFDLLYADGFFTSLSLTNLKKKV